MKLTARFTWVLLRLWSTRLLDRYLLRQVRGDVYEELIYVLSSQSRCFDVGHVHPVSIVLYLLPVAVVVAIDLVSNEIPQNCVRVIVLSRLDPRPCIIEGLLVSDIENNYEGRGESAVLRN